MYQVRRVNIGKTAQLDELAHAWYHRDGVGAINIRRKYLGLGPVVGDMAPPTGMRFRHHSSRSSSWKRDEKFDPGNGEEAAMAFA